MLEAPFRAPVRARKRRLIHWISESRRPVGLVPARRPRTPIPGPVAAVTITFRTGGCYRHETQNAAERWISHEGSAADTGLEVLRSGLRSVPSAAWRDLTSIPSNRSQRKNAPTPAGTYLPPGARYEDCGAVPQVVPGCSIVQQIRISSNSSKTRGTTWTAIPISTFSIVSPIHASSRPPSSRSTTATVYGGTSPLVAIEVAERISALVQSTPVARTFAKASSASASPVAFSICPSVSCFSAFDFSPCPSCRLCRPFRAPSGGGIGISCPATRG